MTAYAVMAIWLREEKDFSPFHGPGENASAHNAAAHCQGGADNRRMAFFLASKPGAQPTTSGLQRAVASHF